MSNIPSKPMAVRDEFGALAAKMSKHNAVLDWRSGSLELIDDRKRPESMGMKL